MQRPAQLPVELRLLPQVGLRHPGQPPDPVAEGAQPVGHGRSGVQALQTALEAVDELGQPAGQLDVAAADVVERQCHAEVHVLVTGQRDAGQHPVEAGPPGVLAERLHLEAGALPAVEAPPHAGLGHPTGDPGEVVVVQPEPSAADVEPDQVEHLAGPRPPGREAHQRQGDREQGVGAAQRAVGQPHPEVVSGVTAGPGSGGDHVGETEAGLDQGGVGLDVGAHHHDVARLEGGVVLEQPDQHLAQHLDLACRAVAGVHLHTAVVLGQRPARELDGRRRVVGPDVGLQVPEQVVARRHGTQRGRVDGPGQDRQRALQLAGVTAERGEQGVSGVRRGAVVVARHRTLRARPGQVGPERGRGLRQPEVDVTVLAECAEQLDLGRRQPGVAEQGEPTRQVQPRPTGRERGQRLLVAHVGRRLADPRHQPPPQLGLPREVLGQRFEAVGVVAETPRPHQVHALAGVRGVQPGQPVGDGVATA